MEIPGDRSVTHNSLRTRVSQSAVLLTVICLALASDASASGDANRATCPAASEASPGYRVSLPDCRAYELVTPSRKNGQPPVTDISAVAPTGEALSFNSVGAFEEPGNDSTSEGGEYVDNRGATGWISTAVNPSATEFQGGSPDVQGGTTHETLDYSGDLTQSVFLAAPRGVKPIDSRFYTRSVKGGAPVEVGPMLPRATVEAWNEGVAQEGDFPPTGYVGATSDLSRVLFSQASRSETGLGWFWPGDTTIPANGTTSLYEYVGTGSTEPELVGVANQTSLAAAAAAEHKAHINEAAELISQCGTYLGGPNAIDTDNALSASGETVFFTALEGKCTAPQANKEGTGPPVPELYARLNREKTVDISEPTTGPTGNCESCDTSSPQLGTFQGAAEDGSKAFFISSQQLFAGSRGESGTNLYEYDLAGREHDKLSLVAPQLAEADGEPGGVVRVTKQATLVYLVSTDAQLATNLDAKQENAIAGGDNLYVYDTSSQQTTFIGTLSSQAQSPDYRDWTAEDHRPVEATPNGQFLMFPSTADLTPDASGEGSQLYRYEAPSQAHSNGVLVRVSVGASGSYECPVSKTVESGFNCNGNAVAMPGSLFAPRYTRESESVLSQTSPAAPAAVAITSDGSKIFFQSPISH